jgi:hypothetical protein
MKKDGNWLQRRRELARLRAEAGPSVYEDRYSAAERTVIVATSGPRAGRIVGYEQADGTFVEAGPCCENPLYCERPECWKPFGRAGIIPTGD